MTKPVGMTEGVLQINEHTAELAHRQTKDSGEREVNEETGFQRDTSTDKYNSSDYKELLAALFLKHQDIDDSSYLDTDYDIDGTLDPTLIHPLLINRVEGVLARGAKKYGTHNWQRGNHLSRSLESLDRHRMQWDLGDTSEDHLAAMVCNIMFLMVHENTLQQGKNFWDDEGNSLGKHPEFADAGALFMDNVRYNINVTEEDDDS